MAGCSGSVGRPQAVARWRFIGMGINEYLAAAYMIGCSGFFGVWSAAAIVTAMRTGIIAGRGMTYAKSSNWLMFWGGIAFHVLIITVGAFVIWSAITQLLR